jgi:hypothetical protein
MNVRMRQVCLVARELPPVVEALGEVFGLTVCHRDPGVGKYGLENVLFAVGGNFLEVVAPVQERTAAGRYLDRRDGDGGYMVITQCDDLARRRRRCEALGVRIANEIVHPDYVELQLHPRDVGGAMLSFARQEGADAPDNPWHPAGGCVTPGVTTPLLTALLGAELQSDAPDGLAQRWSDVLELPVARGAGGRSVIALDDARLAFVPVRDGRGEGLGGLDVRCTDPARAMTAARMAGLPVHDATVVICGTRFVLA